MTLPPLPAVDPDTQAFWDAARRGALLLQRCPRCGPQFYPRIRCRRCGGATEALEASGDGRVYSYTVVHRAAHEALASLVPYAVALVDLHEGVRVMGRIRGGAGSVAVGTRVRVAFEALGEDLMLPVFDVAP